MSRSAAVAALALCACGVTPLTNRIDVGAEPFVVGVGEGRDGNTDLFAASAGGGGFVQLTFTRAGERGPRLSPEGERVAFLREDPSGGPGAWAVVVLDLTTNRELAVAMPSGDAMPVRLGWTGNGSRLAVHAGGDYLVDLTNGTAALRRVPPDSTLSVDSLTREALGQPPIGLMADCPPNGLCIITRGGDTTVLGGAVTDAVRWGGDSVGYAVDGGYEVRPLAGGKSRHPEWKDRPRGLRQLSYHPGNQAAGSAGESGIR